MTTTTATPTEVKTWLEQNHVTITFSTQSGSHYTLVSRPSAKVLIRDTDGLVRKGTHIEVKDDGEVHLHDMRRTNPTGVWRTTPVVSFFVLSN